MRKKANSSIYHFLKNYMKIQILNCIFKIRFNNGKLIPRTEKSRQLVRSKQNGALEFVISP